MIVSPDKSLAAAIPPDLAQDEELDTIVTYLNYSFSNSAVFSPLLCIWITVGGHNITGYMLGVAV